MRRSWYRLEFGSSKNALAGRCERRKKRVSKGYEISDSKALVLSTARKIINWYAWQHRWFWLKCQADEKFVKIVHLPYLLVIVILHLQTIQFDPCPFIKCKNCKTKYTLPSQKHGNPWKNPIYYNGNVPLAKCLNIAGGRTQQKGL